MEDMCMQPNTNKDVSQYLMVTALKSLQGNIYEKLMQNIIYGFYRQEMKN